MTIYRVKTEGDIYPRHGDAARAGALSLAVAGQGLHGPARGLPAEAATLLPASRAGRSPWAVATSPNAVRTYLPSSPCADPLAEA